MGNPDIEQKNISRKVAVDVCPSCIASGLHGNEKVSSNGNGSHAKAIESIRHLGWMPTAFEERMKQGRKFDTNPLRWHLGSCTLIRFSHGLSKWSQQEQELHIMAIHTSADKNPPF